MRCASLTCSATAECEGRLGIDPACGLRRLRRRLREGCRNRVEDTAALRAILDEKVQQKSDALRLLVLAVDRDRSWADVSKVVNAAASAGVGRLELEVQESFRIAPPSLSLDADRERIMKAEDSTSRVNAAARLLRKVLHPCADALKVFDGLAVVDGDKFAILKAELPAALRQCPCVVPPADVMTALWLLEDPSSDGVIRRGNVGASFALGAVGPSPVTFRAGGSERWAQVVQRVVDAATSSRGRPVRFVIGSPPGKL
jgi:hypothetical protein